MDNKKKRILVASYGVALLAVTGGFALKGYATANQYRRMVTNTYQHAFTELTTAVGNLDSSLQKGAYATTPALFSSLCTQAYYSALTAQSAIGELPYGNVELEETSAFLAKVGDYAMSLSANAYSEEGCTAESRALLQELSTTSSALSTALHSLESAFYDGTMTPEDFEDIQQRLSQSVEGGDGMVTAGSIFQEIESTYPEMPTLIYDGPFSAHITTDTPSQIEHLPTVTVQQAQGVAGSALGLKSEIFTLESEGEGNLPTYDFSAQVDGGTVWVEVTKSGGQLLSLFNDRTVSRVNLTAEEAQAIALDFLSDQGYPTMTVTYTICRDNILTVNFATLEGDVVCYPDLVKVSIALDGGQVVGVESHNYLVNHHTRELEPVQVSLAEAQLIVGTGLDILTHQMVVIPTSGQNEVLCHEFKCRCDSGTHILVYVNAVTGDEEDILILLEDETGSLVL